MEPLPAPLLVQLLWKTVWQFFKNYPAVPLLGIYPKELKTLVHTKTCARMFIAELLIIAKKCKQLKCPWTSEQINKSVVYSYRGIVLRNEKTWNIISRYISSLTFHHGQLDFPLFSVTHAGQEPKELGDAQQPGVPYRTNWQIVRSCSWQIIPCDSRHKEFQQFGRQTELDVK